MNQIYCMLLCTVAFIPAIAQSKTNRPHKAGQIFRDCSECPEMVVIPSGSFMMGAAPDEPGRYPEDGPEHLVKIKAFAAGKFDVTKAQWASFVTATSRITKGGCQIALSPVQDSASSWQKVPFEQDGSHPVVCISWDDAQDYVRWLSKRSGATYRLLSEAEWEYAARAGTTTAYPWGPTASHEYANYGTDTTYGAGFASGRDKWVNTTSPVGSFPPNAFGLYDMHGNVMQWVEDCFAPSYSGLPLDGSPYKTVTNLNMSGDLALMNETSSCDYRIFRGGDFADPPRMIRSAFRNWAPIPGVTLRDYRSAAGGFRVAKTL